MCNYLVVDMFSRINGSKRIAIVTLVILVALLAGACGPTLPEQGGNATATNAPTLTLVPPTVTPTSTPDVLYVTDIPTVLPTPQSPPILTPDAIQVERWQEYQTELAKALLYGYGTDPSKDALCEWDILGRSGQEVYAWADCTSVWGNEFRPAVIYLGADGSVKKVSSPGYGSTRESQIQALFPPNVQEKFDLYTGNSLFNGRIREMINHLDYRKTHPAEPPSIVLSAMAATPTP